MLLDLSFNLSSFIYLIRTQANRTLWNVIFMGPVDHYHKIIKAGNIVISKNNYRPAIVFVSSNE